MSVLQSRIFYINSEKRLTGTSSSFTYQLEIPDDLKVDTCCVLAMTIPKSYYLVRDGFNSMTMSVNGVPSTITISPGNYDYKNFRTAFLAQVLGAFGALGTMTMTLDTITGKYTYGWVPVNPFTTNTISFTFEGLTHLGYQMGFSLGTVTFMSTTTLTSSNTVDFVGTSTLFLHSDMVQDSTSILQEVYTNNTISFSNITHHCYDPSMYSKAMQKKGSKSFTFSVADEHGHLVDLNGHDILVTLLLYKKENLTKLLQTIFRPAAPLNK